jgi:uncharacterized oligopeptide transporter (OPT) family protein
MISFAPIEELPPPKPPPTPLPQAVQNQGVFTGSTECSYLLMFFVFGVVALSIKDMAAAR